MKRQFAVFLAFAILMFSISGCYAHPYHRHHRGPGIHHAPPPPPPHRYVHREHDRHIKHAPPPRHVRPKHHPPKPGHGKRGPDGPHRR